MSLKLYYFPLKGKGELIRLILYQAGVDFENNVVPMEEWGNNKPMDSPWGQLPYVEIDGKFMGQSRAIARMLANKYDMAGADDCEKAQCDEIVDAIYDYVPQLNQCGMAALKDAEKGAEEFASVREQFDKILTRLESILQENGSGFVVGNQLTWADLSVADFSSKLLYHDNTVLDGYPNVKKHYDDVFALPNIKAYAKTRPAVPL